MDTSACWWWRQTGLKAGEASLGPPATTHPKPRVHLPGRRWWCALQEPLTGGQSCSGELTEQEGLPPGLFSAAPQGDLPLGTKSQRRHLTWPGNRRGEGSRCAALLSWPALRFAQDRGRGRNGADGEIGTWLLTGEVNLPPELQAEPIVRPLLEAHPPGSGAWPVTFSLFPGLAFPRHLWQLAVQVEPDKWDLIVCLAPR